MIKILYIDDDIKNPADTDPFVSELKLKFQVLTALNGDDAWTFLMRERFDLIILDIMLPSEENAQLNDVPRYKKGKFILENLRAGTFPNNTSTPVLVFSAIADQSDMQKIKNELNPVDEYIEKPVYPDIFLCAVERILSRQCK